MSRYIPLFAALIVTALAALFLHHEPTTAQQTGPKLVGDGKTDNTEAIKALLKQTGNIHLARGVYRITSPIEIDLNEMGRVQISGDAGATLLMDGAGPALKFIGTHDGT